MVNSLLTQTRALAGPVTAYLGALQTWMDSLLVRAEGMPPQEGQRAGGFPIWLIVVIVAAVLLLCVLPVCIILLLALLGPAIGNVFSSINEGI